MKQVNISNSAASIYKITNTINSKVYIGATIQNPPEDRWYRHTNIKQRNQQKSKLLYRAFDKYGIDKFKFEVIYQSLDHEHCLKEMEPYFIKLYESYWKTGKGYNLTLGGEGVWGLKHTIESKQKMSNSQKKRFENPSEIQKIRDKHIGTKHTQEHKDKIKQSVCKYYSIHSGPWRGKTLTDKHKKNLSKARLGKTPTKETVDKIRDKNSSVWEVTFPDNHKEQIKNLRQFCREHNLTTEILWRTSKGTLKHHKKFSAKKLLDT